MNDLLSRIRTFVDDNDWKLPRTYLHDITILIGEVERLRAENSEIRDSVTAALAMMDERAAENKELIADAMHWRSLAISLADIFSSAVTAANAAMEPHVVRKK